MAPTMSTGDSDFAADIMQGRWPEIDPETIEGIAAVQRQWAGQLSDAVQGSQWYRAQLGEALVGKAGQAQLAAVDHNTRLWDTHAVAHQQAASAASEVAAYLRGLRGDLTAITVAGGPEYKAALSERDPRRAQAILAGYRSQADAAVDHASERIATATKDTLPFGSSAAEIAGAQHHGLRDGSDQPTTTGDTHRHDLDHSGTGNQDGSSAPGGNGTHSATTHDALDHNGQDLEPTDPSAARPLGQVVPDQPTPAQPPLLPMMPSPAGVGGAAGGIATPVSPHGGASGLGSVAATSPSSLPDTAAAGSFPATPVHALGGGAAEVERGLGSGLASGVGAPGLAPVAATQPLPPQLGVSQPTLAAPTTTPGAGGGAVTGAGSGLASLASAQPVLASDGVGGAGGALMPAPPMKTPLAPYSPPAAGLPGSTVPPSNSPPAPAVSSSASAGIGPLVAAPGGARASVAPASGKAINPDVVAAQRVLGGLVRACPTRPMFWAVSVLRTPVGPQTVIAGSVGGGAYLPPEVSLPSTVRLAVFDPALPRGWAAAWMGWQSPLAILVDHYERLAKIVGGVTVSVMATSELWPRPPDCGGDFVATPHEALAASHAPPLVGGHRLSATDPALEARLNALDLGGEVTSWVAAQLTRAVWTAAAEPDVTGAPMVATEDADILGMVAEGIAGREHWDRYRRDVQRRADGAVVMPEIHAPRDADDSAGSVHARLWYQHYYAMGRIAEMVQCWASQPVSIRDIAYCGVAAGFGPLVTAVATEIEKQLAQWDAMGVNL